MLVRLLGDALARSLLTALAALALAACSAGHGAQACLVKHAGPGGLAVTHPGKARCPGDPLTGVYTADRLKVHSACVWFHGVVAGIDTKKDGDLHLDVTPDPGYVTFLDKGNTKDQGGALVVEIMPGQNFPPLAVGDHIGVFGTWVHDKHNDWNEMHPVWSIAYPGSSGVVTSLPPRIPEYRCGGNA